MSAPVVLFAYNRPDHTRKVLEALAKNDLASESSLYIYCDAAKDERDVSAVNEVRTLARRARGFAEVEIIEATVNKGLASSVISGVSEVIGAKGRAIVLEDDLLTAPSFLRFMNDCLQVYQDRPDIFSIAGYCHPRSLFRLPSHWHEDVFLSLRNSTWGWATWSDRWNKVDWKVGDYETFTHSPLRQQAFNRGGRDLAAMLSLQMRGTIDSWGIRFSYAHHLHGAYALYPVKSFIDNLGFDGTGVHCNKDSRFRTRLDQALTRWRLPLDLAPDARVMEAFRRIYEPTAWARTKQFIKRLLGREIGGS